jgi:hypothetical protein
VKGVQIQIFVPGAGDAQGRICSGTSRRASPFPDPPAGVLETVREKRYALRHSVLRPHHVADFLGMIWQIDQVLVHGAHMLNPGGERDQVVICIPGKLPVAERQLCPALLHLLVGVHLGIRKEPYKKRKRIRTNYRMT